MKKKCLILLSVSILCFLIGCSSSVDSTPFNAVFEPEDFDRSNYGNFEYEVCPNFYDLSRQELEEAGTR